MRTELGSRRTDRRGRFIAALALALLAPGAARAQDAGAPLAEPNADALIAQGLELRRQGLGTAALPLFQRAHTLAPSPRTAGQLGLVEASLQRWLDADAHLTRALESPAEAWVSGNRKLLDKALAVARQHIGELVVEGPEGTHVFVSGRGAKKLPLAEPFRVAEGEVRVSAIAAGFKQLIQVVHVRGGKRTSLKLELVPNPT
jgi:hypothetical protein